MKTIYWFLLLLMPGACKEKYDAPIHIPATGYLVVEGFINVGNGSTDFTLSRATGLDSPYVLPESGAQVTVESDNGDNFPLTEQTDGKYSIGQLTVDFKRQYRIRIKTDHGKEYLSDFSAPKLTPPIDSVNWKAVDGGVWIYVTTHDPTDSSRYYQWKYEETWEYASAYNSYLEYVGSGQFVSRSSAHQFHICYKKDISTNIFIGSTAKLSDDLMFEYPLNFISYSTMNKLERKYTILVQQNVLTREWYEWKEKIKKNTEQLGSIFDAQPSDISGNIHSLTNPGEPVIGYVGCSSVTEKRIFISRDELPQTYIFTGYEDCLVDTVKDHIQEYFEGAGVLPISAYYVNGGLAGYLGSTIFCIDCREMGGVLTKPAFWQ